MKPRIALIAALAALIAFSPAAPAVAATPITHVVLIVEENHALSQVQGQMPYLSSLGATYAQATSLTAIAHPSLPNYFALTAGSTLGATTDCGTNTNTCSTPAENIYHQADTLTGWSQWSESMTRTCQHQNQTPYIVHHAPAPFFTDLADCSLNDVPLTVGAPPPITSAFTLVSPNRNDDAHSGSLAVADAWLQTLIPKLIADPAYQNGSTLIEVTFDEGYAKNQTVATIFVNPALTAVTVTIPATHYSTLRLNEELLGLPLLANAATAPDIRTALGL